jgi:hypothetical protein
VKLGWPCESQPLRRTARVLPGAHIHVGCSGTGLKALRHDNGSAQSTRIQDDTGKRQGAATAGALQSQPC